MKIVVKANGGLGNRMRVVASCVALSKRLRVNVEVLWVNNEELNCSFDKLFLPLEGIDVVVKKYIPSWNKIPLRLRYTTMKNEYSDYDVQFSDDEIRELLQMKSDFVKLVQGVQTVFVDTCEAFYGDLSHLSYLVPIPKIMTLVERRVSSARTYPLIGVHIRRGDNETSISVSQTSEFITLIKETKKNDPKTKFLLTTDDANEATILKKIAGDSILYYPSSLKRNKPKGIADALVDLVSLSRTDRVFGSYWSSFSEIAAAYGGIPLTQVGV